MDGTANQNLSKPLMSHLWIPLGALCMNSLHFAAVMLSECGEILLSSEITTPAYTVGPLKI